MIDKITIQVMDLRLNYDLIDKKISNYLNWKESKEGKKARFPKINESHKEMLFNKWDSRIKKVEQVAEEAATTTSNVIDCVNENLHRENLISETTPRFLQKAQQLQASWR